MHPGQRHLLGMHTLVQYRGATVPSFGRSEVRQVIAQRRGVVNGVIAGRSMLPA